MQGRGCKLIFLPYRYLASVVGARQRGFIDLMDGLPADVTIDAAWIDPAKLGVVARAWSADWPVTGDGCEIPTESNIVVQRHYLSPQRPEQPAAGEPDEP